jgi:hypothetical protein
MFDKTAYQREYMRRKRAGLPTRQPPKPPKPPDPPKELVLDYSLVCEMERWFRRPYRVKYVLRDIVEGLPLRLPVMEEDKIKMGEEGYWEDWHRRRDAHEKAVLAFVSTDPAWQEAFRRYKVYKTDKEKQKADKLAEKEREDREIEHEWQERQKRKEEIAQGIFHETCGFCWKESSSERKVVSPEGVRYICLECARKVVAFLERKGNTAKEIFVAYNFEGEGDDDK